uniref:Uncharacterized protein n=1 Tax=Anguilla anguilla TaxID=7936 RepID=A0A0E9VLC1_ANGAN
MSISVSMSGHSNFGRKKKYLLYIKPCKISFSSWFQM